MAALQQQGGVPCWYQAARRKQRLSCGRPKSGRTRRAKPPGGATRLHTSKHRPPFASRRASSDPPARAPVSCKRMCLQQATRLLQPVSCERTFPRPPASRSCRELLSCSSCLHCELGLIRATLQHVARHKLQPDAVARDQTYTYQSCRTSNISEIYNFDSSLCTKIARIEARTSAPVRDSSRVRRGSCRHLRPPACSFDRQRDLGQQWQI